MQASPDHQKLEEYIEEGINNALGQPNSNTPVKQREKAQLTRPQDDPIKQKQQAQASDTKDSVKPLTDNDSVSTDNWNTADRLRRRTCPSTKCGIVGHHYYREKITVFESKNEWARITRYYDASCVDGNSLHINSGDSSCTENNGIVNEKFAEWVSVEFLSEDLPPDPAVDPVNEVLVNNSDDYELYKDVFVRSATKLVSAGTCKPEDFELSGGWIKSVSSFKDRTVYFTYCGGMDIGNRIYLDASTEETFK